VSSDRRDGEHQIEILEVVGLEEDEDGADDVMPDPVPASGPPPPRTSEMLERGRRQGTLYVLRELLPALDDLEACVRSRPDPERLDEGVRLALRGLWDVFRRRRLERIEGEGMPFDPAIHDAVTTSPSARVEPGTVIEVMRVGYMLSGELVRPAMVRISRAPDGAGAEPANERGER
jgi:hypothetical protein